MTRFHTIKTDIIFKHPGIGLGSQTKNTVCFLSRTEAVISCEHHDLGLLGDRREFERDALSLLKRSRAKIGCDMHPGYYSGEFCRTLGYESRMVPVQHHHAHIASCMADNGVANKKVIGVAFDGTGLGPDGSLWGGEFFVCDYRSFKRAGHLVPVALPGGEAAIRHPGRLAGLWLFLAYGERFRKMKLELVDRLSSEWPAVKAVYLSGFNSPLTSSIGRFFDSCASIILGKADAAFEAELPQELEKLAQAAQAKNERAYPFRIYDSGGVFIIDPLPVFRSLVRSLAGKEPVKEIARRLHYSVAKMTAGVCSRVRHKTGVGTVILSGGVFQNKVLLGLTRQLLYEEDFTVLTHRNVSCSDSGISLGQAAVASHT